MPETKGPTPRRVLIGLIVGAGCAAAGWFAFLVPYEMARRAGTTTAPNLMDGMQMVSLLLIAGIGFAAGMAAPRDWLLWGPCTMAAFPVVAFVEMIRDPTSHNLWPLEFAFYGVFALPGLGGAWLGALLRRSFTAMPTGA